METRPQRGSPIYRFGVFEADPATGELRRRGVRVRLSAQPFQVLILLLERPGALLTREEISRELWPEGTFVDFEHGVNSTVNRIREALGDRASQPRYVETLARRGYRFIAPVEAAEARLATGEGASGTTEVLNETPLRSDVAPEPQREASAGMLSRLLASPADMPAAPHGVVRVLFVLLQLMYLSFYVCSLANLGEVADLLSALPYAAALFRLIAITAGVLIPVRIFLLCAALFSPPGFSGNFRRLWPYLLAADVLWSLSPLLLLHHISYGLALACTAMLVYAPFAQRSLMLMGAGQRVATQAG